MRILPLLWISTIGLVLGGAPGCGCPAEQADAPGDAQEAAEGAAADSPAARPADPPGASAPPATDDRYRVALHLAFSEDPVFTRFLVDSVRRQVEDRLANYFGALAEVRAVTSSPLVDKVRATGLGGLELTPAEFVERDVREKAFLMAIDFREGLYRVRWRQLDGEVQYVGPVRSKTTPDRQWLSKAVCLAVKHDFAPVAVVLDPTGEEVELAFRGARNGAGGESRLRAWLEGGCVLQPFWVIREPDGTLACRPIPFTGLKIDAQTDWDKAKVVSGLADPWQRTARVEGFKAIKLTTQRGRFRLRLLDTDNGRPVKRKVVYASNTGFGKEAERDRLETDLGGYVVARQPYDHVAYITLGELGGDLRFDLLLPITEPLVEQEWRIPVNKRAAGAQHWRRHLRYCVQDLRAIKALLDQCVGEVNELNQAKHYERALDRVDQTRTALQPLIDRARRDVHRVESEARKIDTADDPLLTWAVGRLGDLEARHRKLRELSGNLARTIKDVDAQSRAEVLLNLAKEAEEAGEYGEAIRQYQKALDEFAKMSPESRENEKQNVAKVTQHLNRLRQQWELRGPGHKRARDFVYQTYTNSSPDELPALLPEAEQVFAELQRFGDCLTILKLAKVNGEHISTLTEIMQMLADRNSEADRNEQDRYRKLSEELLDFNRRVVAAGADCGKEGPPPPDSGENEAPADHPRVDGKTGAEEQQEEEEEEEEEKEEVEEQQQKKQEESQQEEEEVQEEEQEEAGKREETAPAAKPPATEEAPEGRPEEGPPDLGLDEEEEVPVQP